MFRFRLSRPMWVLASSFLFNRSTKEKEKENVTAPAPELVRTPYQHINCTGFECLRESSMIALSATSSFLRQTLYYYTELTQRYCVQISTIINILEEYQRQQGVSHVQQEIWNVYVQQRLSLGEMKTELLRLRALLSTIDRLVNESIDASYQTHDETVTQLVSNELTQAKRLIEQNEQLISKNEMSLTAEQVKLIEPTSNEK